MVHFPPPLTFASPSTSQIPYLPPPPQETSEVAEEPISALQQIRHFLPASRSFGKEEDDGVARIRGRKGPRGRRFEKIQVGRVSDVSETHTHSLAHLVHLTPSLGCERSLKSPNQPLYQERLAAAPSESPDIFVKRNLHVMTTAEFVIHSARVRGQLCV